MSRKNILHNTIVVFPTYYPEQAFVSSNYYADYALNKFFAEEELINDLLPAVAEHYATYSQGTSKSALQASRAHQAFGGFSMGAITTWEVFEHDMAYFKYFMPMAGDSWLVQNDGGTIAPKQTAHWPTLPSRDYHSAFLRLLVKMTARRMLCRLK